VRLLCSTFQEAVLKKDLATIAGTADSALRDTGLLYIRVIGRQERVLAAATAEGFGPIGERSPDRLLDDSAKDGVFDAVGDIEIAGDWFARVEIGLDTTATFAVVKDARMQALKIVALEMALVALFSFILGSLLTRSLRALEDAVNTVASGDFHARVPEGRDDELGRVASSFNAMAGRLEAVRERQSQTVQMLEALSKAQQLHLIGRSETEVYASLLETITEVSFSEDSCIQHGAHTGCSVCRVSIASGLADIATPWITEQTRDGAWVTTVPLVQGERSLGALTLLRRGGPHSERDLAVVLAVAPQLAALVEALDVRTVQARKDQLQRVILSNVIDGIVSVDRQGRIMNTNPAFDRMFGLESQGAVGSEITKWIDAIPDSTSDDPTRKQEARARRASGEEFEIELALAQVGADGDREAFVLLVVGDITERKRVETEMHRAMEASQEAQRAKSAFLANMSHELRTPMNGVLGMLQLLQVDKLTTGQLDNIDTAVSAAEHLLAVLDDVLIFSKAEAGKMELEALPFDLARQVEDSTRLLAHAAFEKGIELTCEVPLGGCGVIGDPRRLKQVLVNMQGNAIKFTEHGSVAVRLLSISSTSTRQLFRIEVEDTGIGIASESLEGLFSPFQQADTSTTRRHGGTGLGLSICRELVGLMGGTLDVESIEGQGAKFFADVEFERSLAAAGEPLPSLSGTQFVIRGDLAQSAGVVRRYLQEMGATEAQSPESAPRAVIVIVTRGPNLERCLDLLSAFSNRRVVITERAWVSDHNGDSNATLMTAPITREELSETMLATERHRESALQLVEFKGEVLLVEDNPVNQRVMRAMLERLGVTCEVVGNGALAVERLKTESFRLILMDCQMPVMDGFEATRALRKRGFSDPIIAVTANVLSEDRRACESAGMDGFLSKPVQLADLQEVLGEHLSALTPVEPKIGDDKMAT
jgi:PAS domain S-box-containing protein